MLYHATLVGGPKDGAAMYLEELPRFKRVPSGDCWRAVYELRMMEKGDACAFHYDFVQYESTKEKTDA